MTKSIQAADFQLGACYYPEHWPETLWADDFRRMKELNFSVIRVAEFAWTIFEPEEGIFQFDLFDRALNLAHEYGLKAIIGTPTATPPAWLTYKYPEVLNVAQSGVVYQHGQRRHYNYSSPVYRELSARITRKLAERYHNHPAVIGWQIDNELNCEINIYYSAADHAAFRFWLQERYGTLERLNQAWGAVFWNQTYSDWQQVFLTRPTVSDSPNPHQALDEKRFISDNTISYAQLQSNIIRELAPNQWVTTNGVFGHLDSHQMTEQCLDFISFDSYPNFSTIYPDKGDNPLLDRSSGIGLSTTRSISPNFCVMEQQSGPGGWVNMMEMPSPKPGQMRLWTYQSIAHGADMLLYFRWRTATFGTEIYWHGINDYHNRPNRRLVEAEKVGKELSVVGKSIVGTKYQANIAIVKDYANEWDGELDKWHGPFEATSSLAWFKALQHGHIPVDLFYMREQTKLEELDKYHVLIYPHPTIMTEAVAQILTNFVHRGGQLIFGCRTGYKDDFGHCYMQPFPGPAAGLCGITVEDFTFIGPHQQAPAIHWSTETTVDTDVDQLIADTFNDIIAVESNTAEVLAIYAGGYYIGKPALVKNSLGQGAAYYYGAVFNEATAKALIRELRLSSPTEGQLTLPKQVELAIREDAETRRSLTFLLNYAETPQTIKVHQEKKELLSGQRLSGIVEMKPFEVFIFGCSAINE